MNFSKLNNISGWIVFAIATLTYVLTLEETASFWDCGEFIAVSYKLMVSHPPGAPFFMLIGRMFSFLALGDVERVAYWINMSSVLSSSFTILFLFWSIVLFGKKMLGFNNDDEIPENTRWTLMISAAVGSLAFTWSDTFWFSAVEAEVYAMSAFFTALVVWMILKWDTIEDESRANRWLILIAYMMGLSIGVHLLNLVTIPALGLIYYFKKYRNVTVWGIIATFLVSGAIVILINNIIIPGLPSVAGTLEITFVNSFGLPFGSGALFLIVVITGSLVWGIMYSLKKQKEILNTALLGLTFVLIGYSSYSIIVIRSNYDPPIDENDPEDAMSFVKYLKREQYGSRPLFYGQYFDAEPVATEEGAAVYVKGEKEYELSDRKLSYAYDPSQMTIFPRIYSTDGSHQARYREILGLAEGETPTFGDNIRYLFIHQLGTMYFRYFLWNFVGRESDFSGAGYLTIADGFEDVPTRLANNKGRNNYWMIPLFMGLLGFFYQYMKDKRNFVVVSLLFFLTGIALILYLNGPPTEPRERDYIYVGSFYAFSIWIGFAVIAMSDFIGGFLKNKKIALGIATVLCATAPLIMVAENWDDHDRSDRFYSVDTAKNFLASVAPNAILFTGGDNDTFPLWYVQEVEGFRTDVRVIVLSYSNTDWYIKQMRQQFYESEPLPLTLTQENYKQGGLNDYLIYEDVGLQNMDIRQFLKLVKEDHKLLRRTYRSTNIVPSRNMNLKVNKEKVLNMGIIPDSMDSLVVDNMNIKLTSGALEKKDLLVLDIIATNNWERPIYVNSTSRAQLSFSLDDYIIQEGNAYRILPVKNPSDVYDNVNTDLMYDNLINNFHYRELDNESVYYTEDYRDFARNLRLTYNTLVRALVDEGKMEKARTAIKFIYEKVPDSVIPYDVSTLEAIDLLFILEEDEMAKEMADTFTGRLVEDINYSVDKGATPNSLMRNMQMLAMMQRALAENGAEELATKYDEAYEAILSELQQLGPER